MESLVIMKILEHIIDLTFLPHQVTFEVVLLELNLDLLQYGGSGGGGGNRSWWWRWCRCICSTGEIKFPINLIQSPINPGGLGGEQGSRSTMGGGGTDSALWTNQVKEEVEAVDLTRTWSNWFRTQTHFPEDLVVVEVVHRINPTIA